MTSPLATPPTIGPARTVTNRPADVFANLRTAWSTNDDAALPPAAQSIWLNACVATLPNGRLDMITAARDDQPVALVPLVEHRHGLWRYWTLLGDGIYEPADVIARDPDALDRLVLALLRRGEPLHFERLPEDSPTISAFRSRGRARLVVRLRHSCPFIPLDESWSDPQRHLTPKRREDLRRAQRRAEQHGPVAAEILTPAAGEVEELLAMALSIESRSWKGEQKTALLHDDYRRPFYLEYAKAACRAGLLRLCFLRLGGQPVAMQIAVQSAGALWLLKVGYDGAFARCSPGTLLIRETIRYAAATGLRSYEFLGDVEPWTQVWTQHEHRCVALDVYPFTVRGMAVCARSVASVLKQKLKQKWKRQPS
jgi:CelD/BcsL family acetyltransferase involved in cellulose biosynthesis